MAAAVPAGSRRGQDRGGAERGAVRARPRHRGDRADARGRRPRAGDAHDHGAQRVDHRHGRTTDPAQPARPPGTGHGTTAAATAPKGHRDAGDRADRCGDAETSTERSSWPTPAILSSAGGSSWKRRGPGSPRAAATKRCASSSTRSSTSASEKARRTPAPTSCSRSAPRRRMRARTCSGRPSATAWRPRPGRVAASTPERGPAGATLPLGALVPLGRYDEALAQLGQLLASTDLSDAERSMTMLFEGFVLLNANRLESAESRFVRATDIGYVQENPRLDRHGRVGSSGRRVAPQQPSRHAALDRQRREHRALRRRRRAGRSRSCAT